LERADALISVIVPARNAGTYIERTLFSVLRQTHANLEIIVVDDGSEDDTATIVEALQKSDGRIRLFRCAAKGVSASRNFGVSVSNGDLIATIDADDLWKPDKLERQLRLLSSAPSSVAVVYCWSAGIDEKDCVVLPVWNRSYAEGDVLHEIVASGILSNGSTPLFRKSAFLDAGGYDEKLALSEDWKFYTALAGVSRFAVIPECLTGYRIRNDSTSVNVIAMEEAITGVTQWIKETWPRIPAHVFRKRAYSVNAYLAFLSIRSGNYPAAMRYLALAAREKPLALFDGSIMQFVVLAIGHRFGLRRYEWKLWRKSPPFLRAKNVS
jgi:glycosyltransferase involved in cell wall biosynthesis